MSTEVYEEFPDSCALDAVTFSERDGRTTVSVLVQYRSREVRGLTVRSGMKEGIQEALDHLEKVAVSLR